MPRNLGGIERQKDERDVLLGSVQAPIQIPASFVPDISWLVRNYQGETPCCGAHAASHFQAILDHQGNPSASQRYTPRYLWIKIKAIDGVPLTSGTDMRAIFKALQSNGADDFEPLENDVTLPITTYSDKSVVTPTMDTDAAQHKILSYAFDKFDFESICQAIYQNKAVLLLIKVDNGFWGTSTPAFTSPDDGHFVCAFGYDTEYLYIVDSADSNDLFGIKKIAKQYVTPTFFFEAGTGLDIPPAQIQAIVNQSVTVAQETVQSNIPPAQQLSILTTILSFLQSLFSNEKVGASPQPIQNMTTANTIILTTSVTFIGIAVNTITTNLWAGIAEFAIGIIGVVVYEKLPPSTPAQ